jgi:hypothetical protein
VHPTRDPLHLAGITRSRSGLLVALFLCSLTLRPQLVGAGPLLPRIEGSLSISHAVAGLLATIPVLCMGLFAPVAAHLLHGVGSRRAIGFSVGLLSVGGLARAFVPSAPALLLFTVPIGIAIAFAGTLLPVAVKENFADRPAFATGVYATAGVSRAPARCSGCSTSPRFLERCSCPSLPTSSRQRVADSRVGCCSWCSSPLLFFCYCVGAAGRPVRPGAEFRAPGEERTPPCAAIQSAGRVVSLSANRVSRVNIFRGQSRARDRCFWRSFTAPSASCGILPG